LTNGKSPLEAVMLPALVEYIRFLEEVMQSDDFGFACV
jgi:hypothetical protein